MVNAADRKTVMVSDGLRRHRRTGPAAGLGPHGGRNAFEHQLHALGITQKNGSPNHPQTQGKIERFHQTLKRWLTGQPRAHTL